MTILRNIFNGQARDRFSKSVETNEGTSLRTLDCNGFLLSKCDAVVSVFYCNVLYMVLMIT